MINDCTEKRRKYIYENSEYSESKTGSCGGQPRLFPDCSLHRP